MKILGIGESVIDKVQTLQNGRHVQHDTTHVGGPVTAALIVLARLGAECHYMTSVGRDLEGEMIDELLKSEGIDATYTHQATTKVNTMVIDAAGQRTKVRSSTEHIPITKVPVARIREADVIIIDRHEPHAFYKVMRNKRSSTQVIIDPSTEVSPRTLDMMRRAEHPIVPIETLTQLATESMSAALHTLYRLCGKPVVVTLGEMGSMVYDGREIEIIPPIYVEVVDTTGAGDVYRGAYAYGILQGWTRQRSAGFANAVAGLQCTRLGNHSAIPSEADLRRLVDSPSILNALELNDIHQYYERLYPQRLPQTV